MLAFHSRKEIKKQYLARVKAHEVADEIIHGKYWEDGKGCAVGCTIHGSEHEKYETELGIPVMLARLQDTLFEGLVNGESKTFPRRFLEAIHVGADLSLVGWKFLHWLQIENHKDAIAKKMPNDLINAIKQCADVLVPLTKGKKVNDSAACSAARSACSAACSAYSAACSAYSAAWSAYSAADSACSAADSAYSAAYSAADSAADSADSAAYSAACSAHYKKMADKLIKLLKEAK